MAVNILLVDDHELFRAGLRGLLADLSTTLVFQEADDCASAVRAIKTHPQPFDLLLLDYHMPRTSGLESLFTLRQQAESASIVVLSAVDDPGLIRQCVESGASGFIPKTASPSVMMGALRSILAGGVYLPPQALSWMPPPASEAKVDQGALTERQMMVLKRVMKGQTNKAIALDLGVSEATVKAHLSIAYRLLGATNRSEAVYAAAQRGWML